MNDIPEKRCNPCGNSFPATADFFTRDKRAKDGLHSQCKKCHSEGNMRSKRRKKEEEEKSVASMSNGHHHASTPTKELTLIAADTRGKCSSCSTKRGNIIGDVDKSTKKRRGYLCSDCYRLAHDPKATPVRLRYVAEYIEKTQLVEYN